MQTMEIKFGKQKIVFQNYPLPYGAPTYSNGKIYFATGGASDTPSYMYCMRDDGTEMWKFVAYGQITSSSPLVYGDKVFFGSSTEFLYVLNANGSELNRIPLNGSVISSPVMGAGRVFAVTSEGRLYAYDYSDLTALFDVNGIQLPIASNDECKSSPVYYEGILYIATRSASGKGEIFAVNAIRVKLYGEPVQSVTSFHSSSNPELPVYW